MTHFSIKVSERLRELGIDVWDHEDVKSPYGPRLRLLRLDDILRLMPAIGEKMGWTLMQKVSSRMEICTAFFNDDHEGAEQHLLTILKQ